VYSTDQGIRVGILPTYKGVLGGIYREVYPSYPPWEAYREVYPSWYPPWEAYRRVYPSWYPPWEAYREVYQPTHHPGRHIGRIPYHPPTQGGI